MHTTELLSNAKVPRFGIQLDETQRPLDEIERFIVSSSWCRLAQVTRAFNLQERGVHYDHRELFCAFAALFPFDERLGPLVTTLKLKDEKYVLHVNQPFSEHELKVESSMDQDAIYLVPPSWADNVLNRQRNNAASTCSVKFHLPNPVRLQFSDAHGIGINYEQALAPRKAVSSHPKHDFFAE